MLYHRLFRSPIMNHRPRLESYRVCSEALKCRSQILRDAFYRSFSYDVTAAMLVYQNKGMAAILVYQANPLGI